MIAIGFAGGCGGAGLAACSSALRPIPHGEVNNLHWPPVRRDDI
jgi:hypothetical protein